MCVAMDGLKKKAVDWQLTDYGVHLVKTGVGLGAWYSPLGTIYCLVFLFYLNTSAFIVVFSRKKIDYWQSDHYDFLNEKKMITYAC